MVRPDIALQRIAHGMKTKTGVLDLGRLGLNRLPDELFNLTHLHDLNLGSHFISEKGVQIATSSNIAPNMVEKDVYRLNKLPKLTQSGSYRVLLVRAIYMDKECFSP